MIIFTAGQWPVSLTIDMSHLPGNAVIGKPAGYGYRPHIGRSGILATTTDAIAGYRDTILKSPIVPGIGKNRRSGSLHVKGINSDIKQNIEEPTYFFTGDRFLIKRSPFFMGITAHSMTCIFYQNPVDL